MNTLYHRFYDVKVDQILYITNISHSSHISFLSFSIHCSVFFASALKSTMSWSTSAAWEPSKESLKKMVKHQKNDKLPKLFLRKKQKQHGCSKPQKTKKNVCLGDRYGQHGQYHPRHSRHVGGRTPSTVAAERGMDRCWVPGDLCWIQMLKCFEKTWWKEKTLKWFILPVFC